MEDSDTTEVCPEVKQTCKSVDAIILGLNWVSDRQIVFVTNQGAELYLVTPRKRVLALKLVKVVTLSINWFITYVCDFIQQLIMLKMMIYVNDLVSLTATYFRNRVFEFNIFSCTISGMSFLSLFNKFLEYSKDEYVFRITRCKALTNLKLISSAHKARPNFLRRTL